jgi:predicted ATP-grasp superfamily ATP-dependent carboligase
LSILKILVFEYITGGGFNKHELPDSLASEGSLMLNALLDNLCSQPGIEITVMLDCRLHDIARDGVYAENLPGAGSASFSTTGFNTVIIKPEHDVSVEFERLTRQSNAVWPIAPEFDGILQALCQSVESSGKILLTSPASAVAIAGNKFKTYELLRQHQIAAVPTRIFADGYSPGEWMVKPVDGVGCTDSYVFANRHDFKRMSMRKGHDCMDAGGRAPKVGALGDAGSIAEYVIQPHLQGNKTSLSCLFKQGSGWLVCANLQRFEFIDQQYHLAEIVVNHHADSGAYQQLVDQIARAFPELWGYVGIDLIETAEQMLVLEINPRLTTSFVGIHAALGINLAEAVLQLVNGKPVLKPSKNLSMTIKVKQEANAS